MDQHHLIAFDRIVRDGSFSGAARTLSLSQAAISARIQSLERAAGGPLFVRGGRRVALTERGAAFLPYARRALAVLAEGIEAARETETGARGRVSLGAITSVTDGLLVPVVARYRATHPQVSLYLRTGHTEQLVRELADGLLQLAVVTWSYATTADVVPVAHLHEPLIGVVAPSHPFAGHGPLSVASFVRAGNPFYHEGWGTPDDARLARLTEEREPVLAVSAEMVRLLVMRGMGATLLPRGMTTDDLAAGRLVAVPLTDDAALVRELALVRHSGGNALSAAAEAFVATMRAETHAMLTQD